MVNGKQYVWDFFTELRENNSKEWMDANRDRYHNAKQYWLDEVGLILDRLATHDPSFGQFEPREVTSRITNNRMFHPDRPVYRTNFTCAPAGRKTPVAKIFFGFGPDFTLIGGGLYRPEKEVLKSVREAIDFEGDELKSILKDQTFVSFFGGLSVDEEQLKTAPKGYAKDHPHVALLRRKNFTAIIEPSKEILIDGNVTDLVEEAYLVLRPFTDWLNRAISV